MERQGQEKPSWKLRETRRVVRIRLENGAAGSRQALDVTEKKLNIDQSVVRNHWRIPPRVMSNLIYSHFGRKK